MEVCLVDIFMICRVVWFNFGFHASAIIETNNNESKKELEWKKEVYMKQAGILTLETLLWFFELQAQSQACTTTRDFCFTDFTCFRFEMETITFLLQEIARMYIV